MFSAVILAGGKGERFGSAIPKPFMSLNGKPVIQYSIDVLEPLVDEVVIVCNCQYKDYHCVEAGDTRNKSAFNGLKASKGDYILFHEGARPFLRKKTVEDIKGMLLQGYDCADTVSPILDGYMENGIKIDKKGKYLGLTPEGFKRGILESAYSLTSKRDWMDEITMVQTVNKEAKVGFVETDVINSKITYEQDLGYAEGIMRFWNDPITTVPNLNKKVLIFGGSSGIGKACKEKLKDVFAPTRQEVDLSKAWGMKLEGYDAIIYSAGEYIDEKKIMKVNFESCVRLVKLAEEQNWKGNIVFLSSSSSTYGRQSQPVYSASKAALNSYIEARHRELAEKGILINAIAPCKVNTRLLDIIHPDVPRDSVLTPEYVANHVLKYLDTDVSGHIIFLRKGFDE
jgi:ribitol-5-phosphate 2-dehydrogenase (NADP+) / D-ribitol-5-phosphate cytidylyltransferase